MACETVREQLEEYALGLLDANDEQAVAQHVQGCAACRRLLDDYAAVVATLPQALAAVSPHSLPEDMKTRLLATVSSRTSPTSLPGHIEPASPLRPGGAVAAAPPVVVPNAHLWRLRIALVAALLLLVLLVAWSIRLNVALARERALRAEIVDLVGHQQELVIEVVDSSQTTRHVLRSPLPEASAYGKLFTRAGLPHVVAMAARLPAPPPGEQYHLWLTSGGQTELAGLLDVNLAGFGLLIYEAETDQPVYEAAEVTLQRPGGATPVGESILVWRATDD
jgi:anti-sigma factor RsiW